MCDAHDIGVHSDPGIAARRRSSGGADLRRCAGRGSDSASVYSSCMPRCWRRAREQVAACACQDGCPSCVGPGGENGYGGKRETLALLENLCA